MPDLGAPDPGLEVLPAPSLEWLSSKAALNGYAPRDAGIFAKVVARLERPSGFAALRQDGRMAAQAYGVLHDELLCVAAVVTDPRERGRGHARRLLRGLFHWAAERGGMDVCIQVEAANAPAVALYRRLGVTTELYRYHYRRKSAG